MTLTELRALVAPGKRDPHPCVTRCFRVGGPVDLDERGKCPECGMPTDINTSPTCELPRSLVLVLIDALEAAEDLRGWYSGQMGPDGPEARFDAAMAQLEKT